VISPDPPAATNDPPGAGSEEVIPIQTMVNGAGVDIVVVDDVVDGDVELVGGVDVVLARGAHAALAGCADV